MRALWFFLRAQIITPPGPEWGVSGGEEVIKKAVRE
jgi:hypothetical protein